MSQASSPEPASVPRRRLPFSTLWPLAGGALAGLLLRLLFSGRPGEAYTAMAGSFIFLSPILVGMVTVYLAERRHRRSWAYYFWAPLLATFLYVLGTLAILIEGLICAVLILPMFALLGAFGGLFMGLICRLTDWPRQTLYSFALLPLLLGGVEDRVPLSPRLGEVERSVYIDAPPAEVWRHIENARDIKPEEVDAAWMYKIGVPLPRSGVTQQTAEGLVRRITMGKDIYFDQVVADWQPGRRVRWTYHFFPDSFPPKALDDHVRIGGAYFDLRDTSYTLSPEGAGTRLSVRMGYRVSTRFNWYAEPLAELLMGNFEEVILNFYLRRSESAAVDANRHPGHIDLQRENAAREGKLRQLGLAQSGS